MLRQILIGGIDVSTTNCNFEYEKTYGDALPEIVLKFVKSVSDLVTLSTGQAILVYRGWALPNEEKIFDGYIEKVEPDSGIVVITAIDKIWDTVRREVNTIYDASTHVTAGNISAIFQDLINIYASDYNSWGTNSAVTANKLRDGTADFVTDGVAIGDNVWNEDTNAWTTVTNVDSAIQLTLASDIFPVAGGTGKTYVVKPVTAMIADDTSVQDSGGILTIDKFICNHTDIFERCKKLSDALGWQFYYDASTNKVYFENRGFSTNPTILTVGDNIIQIPKWQYDNTEMVNDVTFVGAYQDVQTTEVGTIGVDAGYTANSITLSYVPISVKVYDNDVSATVPLIGGMPDSTSTYDYYVDKENKQILPAVGDTFTNAHEYEIRYSLAAPIPIHFYNQSSIDTYGLFKKTITLTDVRSVEDAEIRAQEHLTKYSQPFIYSTIKVKNVSTYNLEVGQNIRVIDNLSPIAVDRTLLINKIRIRYPTDYDELDVGDKYWRVAEFNANIMEKFKRFEEDELANQDLVNENVTIDNSSFAPINVPNRYQQVITQTASGTNLFILGNVNYGVLGTNKLGDAGLGAETTRWLRQQDNIYDETFYDTDFKSASTTATWDTANKWLLFAAGQIGQSTSVDYNNGTITSVYVAVTVSAGSVVIYTSADGGSHWEASTNNATHTFSTTGTDLRWKITSVGVSKVTEVQLSSYH